MQNPGKDIVEVVRILLCGTIAERQRVVDTCFTPDVVFEHPLVLLKGRSELMALYQYWFDMNLKLDFDMPKIVVSEGRDRIVLDFNEFITPYTLPWGSILLRLIVFLDLKKTPAGFKICKQEDHILWLESARKNIPPVNYYYEHYVRRATGLGIVKAMEVVGLAARFLYKEVLPRVPWVKQHPELKQKLVQIQQALDPHTFQDWKRSEKGIK